MLRVLVLAAVLGGALSSAAGAQPVAAPEGVDYLVGRWVASAQDPATRETVLIDYNVERAAGGAWLAGAGRARDGSLNSRDMWGRDPLTREIIRVVFDGSGALATVRSPGWEGDRLVLEGDVRSPGGTVRVRETITRLGRDRFRAVWEAYRDGRWAAYSIEDLTRQT
jgi:hypothetical protein